MQDAAWHLGSYVLPVRAAYKGMLSTPIAAQRRYRVEWPMSLVLDSDAQAQYNQILVLILQARRQIHQVFRSQG